MESSSSKTDPDDAIRPLLAIEHVNGVSSAAKLSQKELKHCHLLVSRNVDNHGASKAKRQLSIACALVIIFITGEVVGGYLSGSLAIMSDAAHMFSDLASFLISLLAIHLSEKPAKKSFTFGYKRAEILGALLSIVTIWYVTGVLLYLAIHRLNTNEFEVESDTMMAVAGAAVVFNIFLGILLHGVCQVPHTHSHGGSNHSHLGQDDDLSEADSSSDLEDDGHRHQHGHSHGNINIRAALIHVLGDFLQSLGVLLSSIVIKFCPSAKWADPACTIVFSIIVFCTTIKILRDTTRILMEGSPHSNGYDEISRDLSQIGNVVHVHDLHLWSLTVGHTVLSVHLAIDNSKMNESNVILHQASGMLKEKYKISSVTIQMEEYDDDVTKNCQDCTRSFQ